MIPIGGVSTDVFLPSLPAISAHFMVTKAWVQLMITFFVIAMALGQSVAGAISDALGRKKLILVSMVLQCICILGILFSPNIDTILVLRFIQGLAVAFLMVPARAVTNDLFEGEALKKGLSYLTISFALSPILAPFIGGYIQHYFGWQGNFIFMLGLILLALMLVVFTLPETLLQTKPFSPKHIFQNYRRITHDKDFLTISIFAGTMMGYSTLFSLLGPFIIITVLKKTSVTYGYMALVVGAAWLVGNIFNRLTFSTPVNKKMPALLWSTFTAIIIQIILVLIGYFNLWVLVAPLFVMTLCSAWIFGICVADGLSIFKDIAASANAFFFSIGWLIYGLISILGVFLKTQSLAPITTAFLFINVFCMMTFYGKLRQRYARA